MNDLLGARYAHGAREATARADVASVAWSPAGRCETGRADDAANARSPSPPVLPAYPVDELAAEARRALSEAETSAARLPSQSKQAMCAAHVANEATNLEGTRLTPELSRAEGVGLNEWLGLVAGVVEKRVQK